jgi:hypothetical protein
VKKADIVTCGLSSLNLQLKKFNNWKRSNAVWP